MFLFNRYSAFKLVMLVITCRSVTSRELNVTINPGCILNGVDCSTWTNTSLIHIRSDDVKDVLHFIWSFNGSPSLLLARTLPDTTLEVDWDSFISRKSNSIKFRGTKPIYTFAYTVSQVLIYNDANDKVRIDKVNQDEVSVYNTQDFVWERQDYMSILNSSDVELTFNSTQFANRSLGPDGFFLFSIRAKEADGYSNSLPYMLHNHNMSQIDIAFSNVRMDYPNANPPKTRVAFTFTLVQGDEETGKPTDAKMSLERVETLDDEHTPGVFSTMNIRTPLVGKYDQSFLQWKPICYTKKVRDIIDSVDITSYDIQQRHFNTTNSSLNSSLLWAYYGTHLEHLSLHSANISFGTKKDGYYNTTKHISWTHMAGFGAPPEDYVSLLVILVVSIGFGIPLFIIVVSSLYIIYKRISRSRDELLLNH